jgi:hypothetical protein
VLLDYLLLPTLAYVVSAAAMRAIVPSIPQAAWVLLFIASNTTVNLLGIETTARASKICDGARWSTPLLALSYLSRP